MLLLHRLQVQRIAVERRPAVARELRRLARRREGDELQLQLELLERHHGSKLLLLETQLGLALQHLRCGDGAFSDSAFVIQLGPASQPLPCGVGCS